MRFQDIDQAVSLYDSFGSLSVYVGEETGAVFIVESSGLIYITFPSVQDYENFLVK